MNDFIIILCATTLSCPFISFASSNGASQLHHEIVKVARDDNSEKELYSQYKYTEYSKQAAKEESQVALESINRGANTIDVSIPAGGGAVTNDFEASAGKGVKVIVSGDSSSDTFSAGIANDSSGLRYVNSQNGSVNYTFKITESGTYSVYFENTSEHDIHILGTIYVNY